jgi:hypothetical protein
MAGKAARTGWATVEGPAPRFTPGPDAWTRIEGPYGHTFSTHDRAKICAIMDRCLDWSRFEVAEPRALAVAGVVEQFREAVRSFNGALNKIAVAKSDAEFQAKAAVEHQWRGGDHLGANKLKTLMHLCLSLARDSQHTIKYLKGEPFIADSDSAVRSPLLEPGNREGNAENKMLSELLTFARRRGLSVVGRNDPQNAGGPSVFPQFVFAVLREAPIGALPKYTISTITRKIHEAARAQKRAPVKQKTTKVRDAF